MFEMQETNIFYDLVQTTPADWKYLTSRKAYACQKDKKFRIELTGTGARYQTDDSFGRMFEKQTIYDNTFALTYDGRTDQEVTFIRIEYDRYYYIPKIPKGEKEVGCGLVLMARILNEDHLYCKAGSECLIQNLGYTTQKLPPELLY